jgi:hypothetical protein
VHAGDARADPMPALRAELPQCDAFSNRGAAELLGRSIESLQSWNFSFVK